MKKILITGANRGLGYELLKVYINSGSIVYPLVRTRESAELLTQEFTINCYPIISDLNTDDSIYKIDNSLKEITTSIDILINNAGISGRGSLIEEVDTDEVNNLFNIHCLGPIRAVKGSIKYLRNSESPKIINISSRLGSLSRVASGEFNGMGFSYSYRMAKAAQNMLTICLSQELKNENIMVSAVHPGRLITRGGSPDSDTCPSVAAENIYMWISETNIESTGKYMEPNVKEIAW
ncbi:SDR family NAD(P)-dependent oxidoreductase [Paenibacillus crassostreae]|uniref:Short-chain dehydrogenase n=1 Tax=Paenibacillus crassostreae TaxID=1763538 RepID=A0A167BW66_9BACL|nr:SDR family NAD(P)-dependent oxidoreductase [Paenibacillus crassostreae]AOZ92563.1 short-chain dehydrogenase [Paenibacillus crassostreae]OAB72512.1 short-chain dehydrogenase [Paenibacillus crassostreae]